MLLNYLILEVLKRDSNELKENEEEREKFQNSQSIQSDQNFKYETVVPTESDRPTPMPKSISQSDGNSETVINIDRETMRKRFLSRFKTISQSAETTAFPETTQSSKNRDSENHFESIVESIMDDDYLANSNKYKSIASSPVIREVANVITRR